MDQAECLTMLICSSHAKQKKGQLIDCFSEHATRYMGASLGQPKSFKAHSRGHSKSTAASATSATVRSSTRCARNSSDHLVTTSTTKSINGNTPYVSDLISRSLFITLIVLMVLNSTLIKDLFNTVDTTRVVYNTDFCGQTYQRASVYSYWERINPIHNYY